MFKKIGKDKWKHFYVGIVLGAVFQIFFYLVLPGEVAVGAIITVLFVAAISYGFELFSLFTGFGHYDVMDAVAGIIGGIVGLIPVVIYQYL